MNKSFKLGSLVLAGIVLIGCNKTDPEAEKAKQKAEADQARKGKVENPTTVPSVGTTMPTMGSMEKKAGDAVDSGKEKVGEGLEKLGKEVKPGPTTMP